MDSAQCSDDELVERSRRGDEAAFSALVTRHKAAVFSFLRHALSSREDAEDLTQETFVHAYLSLPRFRGEPNFSTWLLAIAHHCLKSHWRTRRVTENLDDALLNDVESLPDVALCLDVRRAVAALPLPYRQVVILRYVHNLSYKDIADVLGISAAAAEVRAHRAREMLRQRLSDVVNEQEVNHYELQPRPTVDF